MTRAGGNPTARRTILCNNAQAFVLYRIGVRFGLPVLAEWSEWFSGELEHRKAIQPLIGIGCAPVLVKGTKKRFLGWIGHALKRGAIRIPDDGQTLLWHAPVGFSVDLDDERTGGRMSLALSGQKVACPLVWID